LAKLLPYILFEKYISILSLEMASPGNQNQHCANCIGTLSFPANNSKRAKLGDICLRFILTSFVIKNAKNIFKTSGKNIKHDKNKQVEVVKEI